MSLSKCLSERIVILDGGMGTQLQQRGLPTGCLPEAFNFTHPEVIRAIHRDYSDAGADILVTNTFGANRLKLESGGLRVEDVIPQAIRLAREAAPDKWIAQDLGPLGYLMKPMGEMTFEEAYELFAEQIRAGASEKPDLLIIETISDLQEARAAVLAARENSTAPIWCSLTYSEDGRTLSGTDPITACLVLQDMGIQAIGINCSLGPEEFRPLVESLLSHVRIPVFIEPNAGIPMLVDGETVFPADPDRFAEVVGELLLLGVQAVGGCCGTTPVFIKKLAAMAKNRKPVIPTGKVPAAVCSSTRTVFVGERIRVIGERINPTGKKLLKEALKASDWSYTLQEAIRQVEAGADILDVNVGLPGINEKDTMLAVLETLEGAIQTPLQIDSASPEVLEAAVRRTCGKVIINSVNGKQSSMDTVLPVAARYGANIVALLLDEEGVPDSCEKRVEIAERIITEAAKYGIGPERIFVDCLVLTASAEQKQAGETLKAIQTIKARWPVHTVLGASNVSFGLPIRSQLNRTFMAMALQAGLDAPITDPLAEGIMETIRSYEVLSGKDANSADYIQAYGGIAAEQKTSTSAQKTLGEAIAAGMRDEAVRLTVEHLKQDTPMAVVDGHLIPALEKVGADFEKGRIFLPQLLKSAEAVKAAFDHIREAIHAQGGAPVKKGSLALATVHGDIHDIGKNIVKVLLENYGFEVHDLGRDVPTEIVLNAIREHNLKLVGLSALMTTTVLSMEETVDRILKEFPDCRIFVGGAVLTKEYADKMGAHFYCKDAQESVRVAQEIFDVK